MVKKRHTLPRCRTGLNRNEADYEDVDTSERRAYQILRWAREFVERVEEVVSHERRPE